VRLSRHESRVNVIVRHFTRSSENILVLFFTVLNNLGTPNAIAIVANRYSLYRSVVFKWARAEGKPREALISGSKGKYVGLRRLL